MITITDERVLCRDELWLASLALLCELSCLDTSLFLECGLDRWAADHNYTVYILHCLHNLHCLQYLYTVYSIYTVSARILTSALLETSNLPRLSEAVIACLMRIYSLPHLRDNSGRSEFMLHTFNGFT